MNKMLALLLLVAPAALADSTQPSHPCTKPDVPAQFKDEAERDQFSQAVNTYHKCISDFITAQNEAAHKHRLAAQTATDEWNAFANSMK